MDSRVIELKVGGFILIGVLILFILVFSIGDLNLVKEGYRFRVMFDFVNGLGISAPVRLAGVSVGQVESIATTYDENEKKTRAVARVWVRNDAMVEEDASITINTLGLLGEKYLEIIPGTSGKPLLKDGATIRGKDPVPMEKVTENLEKISTSITIIAERLKNGEGTIGKLLTEEAVYDDLKAFMGNLKVSSENLKTFSGALQGNGSVGRLLFEDPVRYDLGAIAANFKDFSEDIKRHPWKLLSAPREK